MCIPTSCQAGAEEQPTNRLAPAAAAARKFGRTQSTIIAIPNATTAEIPERDVMDGVVIDF